MLKVSDIAAELKVNPQTVYRWIYKKKLISIKVGGVVRIKEADFAEFIKSSRVD